MAKALPARRNLGYSFLCAPCVVGLSHTHIWSILVCLRHAELDDFFDGDEFDGEFEAAIAEARQQQQQQPRASAGSTSGGR